MSKRNFISNEEIDQATKALVEWLKSQDLKPHNAAPVLVKTLAVALAAIASDQEDAFKGAEACHKELLECLKGNQ